MTVTEADYARMSWRDRQRLNDRLRHERDTLLAEVASIRETPEFETADAISEARAILADLDPDPDAGRHRYALGMALTHTTTRTAA